MTSPRYCTLEAPPIAGHGENGGMPMMWHGVRERTARKERRTMILEAATLNVRVGEETAFETALTTASTMIAATPGYGEHTLHRCRETALRYLLLVHWDRLEDDTLGFRPSPRYHEWRSLLHHVPDPVPTVEHFALVGDWSISDRNTGAAR